MQRPPKPPDEATRVSALRALDVLYTPSEERFDRITRLARRLLDTPIALLTIVGEDVQWFKSAQGLEATETARDVSFCGHTILAEAAFVVEDTANDQRFADNPLVVGDDAIPVRFYAGYPVHAGDGSRVGTICLIDHKPRSFSSADEAALRDFAALVDDELQRGKMAETQRDLVRERDDLQRRAMTDDLTRGWNRGAILELLDRAVASHRDVAVAMIDADHFKRINDGFGHPTGDAVLAEIAARLRAAVRPGDAVGRYGGEEFCVILDGATSVVATRLAERLRLAIAGTAIIVDGGEVRATVSIGIATTETEGRDARALIAVADAALYRAKAEGRDRVVIAMGPSPLN